MKFIGRPPNGPLLLCRGERGGEGASGRAAVDSLSLSLLRGRFH